MTYTYSIIEDIINKINDELLFTIVCSAIRGYGNDSLPLPLDKTYLSVVPEENKSSYFVNEDGLNCVQNHITIRINFFAPKGRKPEYTHALAESVYEFLSGIYLENLTGYEIGDTEYDGNVKAFRLSTRMFMYYESCPLDEENAGTTMTVPENFFCKAHVNNTVAHLTSEEHSYLNQPFVTGVYKGTGSAVNVELGFKPSALIAFRYGHSPCVYNSSTGKTDNFTGFSFAGRYNYGLVLTDTGFTASQYSGTEGNNYMSVDGGYYAYIAFK